MATLSIESSTLFHQSLFSMTCASFSLYAFSIISFVVVVGCGIPSLSLSCTFYFSKIILNENQTILNYTKAKLRPLRMLILTFVKDLYCLYYQRYDSDGISEYQRLLEN